MKAVRPLLLIAPLLLTACASSPSVRYYTLQAPVQAAAVDRGMLIQVLPVQVPAQVDVPELVIRQGAGEMARVETEQWIAPLPTELRAALSQHLQDRLGARDIQGLAHVDTASVHRIRIVITRFEAYLDHRIDVAASWTLHGAQNAAPLTCATQVRETVAAGYPALVAGYQRALAGVGDAIAQAVTTGATHCPEQQRPAP